MVTKDYVSLHPEYGGPAKGFRCERPVHMGSGEFAVCSKVTRTESGMKAHLRIKHGIKLQGDLFNDGNRNDPSNDAVAEVPQEESEPSSKLHAGLESETPGLGAHSGGAL